MPEVMHAIALRGGRIWPRVVVAKVIALALCIGSGGSAGREGPIVQVGAALGSSLGQLLHFSDARIRNLVACGAAAGIAATFLSGSLADGRTVAELSLPREAVLVSIRRGGQLIIPHGDTRVSAGDVVTTLCERQCAEKIRAALTAPLIAQSDDLDEENTPL